MFSRFARKASIATLAAAATIATVGIAVPAQAAPRQMTVSFADLDLASSAGAAELDKRIGRAARAVCAVSDPGAAAAAAQSRCRNAALVAAAPQMETALANARSGEAYAATTTGVSVASAR
ncbi:UrcA family protein [Sphingomonas sp. 1P06PA]|uniref:UrcA family protein n=1 Tax=Sphingomonas sp. 1P06PA TaxID=554121 RepID=UPI0039A5C290